jgi:hypothetical protein
LLLIATSVVLYVGIQSSQLSIGVGYFSQQIVVESDKPIRKLSYANENVDAETRRLAEETAVKGIFDKWWEAQPVGEHHYQASIMFDGHQRFIWIYNVTYQRQLAVFAEFTDGSRAYRVVDLPLGRGREHVVVRFP